MNFTRTKKTSVGLCAFLVLVILTTGCGKKRPEGLGKTYPCSVEVTKGGEPLDDAKVILLSKTGIGFTMVGKTGTDGIAKIVTEFDYPGVPEGTYSVAIIKPPQNPVPEKTEAELEQMSMAEKQAYSIERGNASRNLVKIIPDHLTVASASPLEVVVTATGENKFKFEIDDHRTPPSNWRPPNTNYDSSRPR